MLTTLGQIADLRTGIYAKPGLSGGCVYLQAKDFDEDGKLSSSLYADLEINRQTEKHLLKTGDVLFAAKGSKNFAALFAESDPPSVASTTFLVVTVRDARVSPEYLVWYLNNQSTQNYLKREAIGSAMVSISKEVLAEMEIRIPPLTTQEHILRIAKLSEKEHELRSNIAKLRQSLIQYKIDKALK
ncbi:MAG: restriction endonuclease subunit S [Pyrinomonadaceae bacterium]